MYDSKEALPKPSGTIIQEVGNAQNRIPYYSPSVMHLAAKHGIDLRAVKGSGLYGRITRKDVLDLIRQREAGKIPADSGSLMKAAEADLGSSSQPGFHNPQVPSGNPAATMLIEADVTNLVQLLRGMEETFWQKERVKLSQVPFYLKAIVNGLKEYPAMNAVWESGMIAIKKDIHITITADSGVTSLIEHADGMSIAGFAFKLGRQAANGRRNDVPQPAAVAGGTFAFQAAGPSGPVIAHPAMQEPQSALLFIGTVVQRPVIKNDMIGGRFIVNLCLSTNHHMHDPPVCVSFLNSVKHTLENYDMNTLIY
ncbi:2-oxo acid dehydrogenase subunit E2 [Paenibacillus mendelii]|uniref:2-oxo acid dehydrogenase subunit E2 n=1 Tax=Paenibacillus mendelii TaxID=206163 RepID=A0ABV6JHD1_9BACL|nr:2-oxo acid dehydrogenase subunit E2 [Paenibacillus mendelii]MCQ6557748.1 2-oxo acid dehydrogenase subunit E2 [Paenibacillus mendelii]